MGLIRNTVERIQSDLYTLERIKQELPRSNPGKHRALLHQKVMVEQRVKSRIQTLKESITKPIIRAIIIVDLGDGPQRYYKNFYGLTPQEVRDLLDIEFYYLNDAIGYTLVSLEEVNTNSEWTKLMD